jgi:hypothetical protein
MVDLLLYWAEYDVSHHAAVREDTSDGFDLRTVAGALTRSTTNPNNAAILFEDEYCILFTCYIPAFMLENHRWGKHIPKDRTIKSKFFNLLLIRWHIAWLEVERIHTCKYGMKILIIYNERRTPFSSPCF